MLVVIKYPYVLKRHVKEELEEKYSKRLNDDNAVLIVDAGTQVTVYKKDSEEPIDVKIITEEIQNELQEKIRESETRQAYEMLRAANAI